MMYVKVSRHDRTAFVPCSLLSFRPDRGGHEGFIEAVFEGRDDHAQGNHVLVDKRGGCHEVKDLEARTPEEFFKKCLENDCLFFSGTESSEFKMSCALKSGDMPS